MLYAATATAVAILGWDELLGSVDPILTLALSLKERGLFLGFLARLDGTSHQYSSHHESFAASSSAAGFSNTIFPDFIT